MYSKTELTEIRKQIFPRYFLQNVAIVSDTKNNLRLEKVSCGNLAIIERLQLKHLSSITDEDRRGIANLLCSHGIGEPHYYSYKTSNQTVCYIEFLSEKGEHRDNTILYFYEDGSFNKFYPSVGDYGQHSGLEYDEAIPVFQYLQLKGYALPQLVILNEKPITLSVEQQIESLIIETKN